MLARALRIAALATAVLATAAAADTTAVIDYDSFERAGGYTIADYETKWSNPYGLGEMVIEDTRSFAGGRFNIAAAPFRTGYDFSVFDHLKYIAISTQAFAVPRKGSITFSSVIDARTPGTDPKRVIEGTYIGSGLPYAARVLEGQQAGAVMNVIDFATGQLFDWFVAGRTAFALIERLPSSVTGSPDHVGRDKTYTQIIREVEVEPGPHTVSITFSRHAGKATVEYHLDGKLVARVRDVGVPLDVQGVKYTGIYPSLGAGEPLADRIDYLVLGHGLFSLLDAFPFQHPEVPELSVSIPLGNRLFGQGAIASFDDFKVTIVDKD